MRNADRNGQREGSLRFEGSYPNDLDETQTASMPAASQFVSQWNTALNEPTGPNRNRRHRSRNLPPGPSRSEKGHAERAAACSAPIGNKWRSLPIPQSRNAKNYLSSQELEPARRLGSPLQGRSRVCLIFSVKSKAVKGLGRNRGELHPTVSTTGSSV